jgi:hypothetical protein
VPSAEEIAAEEPALEGQASPPPPSDEQLDMFG